MISIYVLRKEEHMVTVQSILEKAKGQRSGRIALAAAHDKDALESVCLAKKEGIAEPILVGQAEKIAALLTELGYAPEQFSIIDAGTDAECAEKAVRCVHDGKAEFLMKGLVSTPDLMRAVLNKEWGLRTGKTISHIMFYDIPGYKLVALTDGGMSAFPDLNGKVSIVENCVATMRALGWGHVNCACLCGAEQLNPKFQNMVDADALSKMTDRWTALDISVYGPVGFDLAVSPEACRHKKYTAPGAGEADILLVPNYEVGNNLGKSLSLFGGAQNAGVVVGAAASIILVSRADSARTKLLSIAFGAVASAYKE